MFAQEIEELLSRTGFPGTAREAEAISVYLGLLEKWNTRVNLTASTRWESIAPLLGEAVWAASLYTDRASIGLDIGSGAGFPAIPMRIMRPRMSLYMIEARAKRAAFLSAAVQELALAGTTVIHMPIEDYLRSADPLPAWDTVSWKALKLGRRAFGPLIEEGRREVRFWLFHGRDLPLRDALLWDRMTELCGRAECPLRKGWFVSIYSKKSC